MNYETVKSQNDLEARFKLELAKHKCPEALMLPYLRERCRITEQDSGGFCFEALNDAGESMLSRKETGNPMKITEFVESALIDTNLMKKPDASDSDNDEKPKNPWKKESFNLTEQMRLTSENPALAKRLQREANQAGNSSTIRI